MSHIRITAGWLTVALGLVWVSTLFGQEGSKPRSAPADEPPASAGEEATPADGKVPKVPSPEDVIKAFQRDRPSEQPLKPLGSDSRPETDPNLLLLREGESVHRLAGRLTRDGVWWSIVFESDSIEAPRPPMRLLPNQQLERMIRESEASAEDVVFVVSGEVTLFQSANYLLLRQTMRRRNVDNLSK